MKFTNKEQRLELTMVKIKLAAKDSERRLLNMEFSFALGLSESQFMPSFLKDAWSSMRRSGSQAREIDLDGEIPSQNVSFYRLPKEKQMDMHLGDVALTNLWLEKIGNNIFLHFTIQELVGKRLWDWCWYAFARSVFAEFVECQQDLAIPAQGKAAAK